MMDKFLFSLKVIITAAIIASACALASSAKACCAVVNVHPDSRLNVRTGPGTEYRASAGLSAGAEIHILQERDGWALIAWPKYPDHPLGWVSTEYVNKKTACAGHTDQ